MDGVSEIAEKFHIPQIVIGLTIVAFGTSALEAAISISAAFAGTTGIAIGNILGSNLLNILVIPGISACIVPLHIGKSSFKFDIPFKIGDNAGACRVWSNIWQAERVFRHCFLDFSDWLYGASLPGSKERGESGWIYVNTLDTKS